MIESADLHKYLPSTVGMSSSQVGWRSLLLRHYIHEREAEEFEIPPVPDQTIVLVTSGATLLEFYSRGSWTQSNHVRGNIVMSPPRETGKLRWRGVEHHETLHLHLPSTTISAALDDLRDLRPGLKAFAASLSSPDPLVTEVVLALARAARDGVPDLYAESAAHFLARHLLDRHALDAGRSPRSGESARLGRVEDYLRSHISDPVSLGDLAGIAGCSTFQLIRFCKSHWGETPFRRLTHLRMERARELLRHTDVSIINISLECGYGNPAHFATAFRRSVGMSPSDYRAG
jgi:AraC family transcriptional regulator